MHSLYNDDFLTGAASALPSLTAAQRDHLRGKLLPRDLLAEGADAAVRDRAHGLRRWLRSQAGLLREKLDHPLANGPGNPTAWRAELRTLEQVRERLILAELAPAGWLLEDGADGAGCGDVCHGMEVGR